jgi:hypothetical protein
MCRSAGDLLKSADDGSVTVESVHLKKLNESVDVYNFEVVEWHTYYVSSINILAHNDCTRNEAFNQAKRDARIPASQQPDKVVSVNMTDQYGHVVKDTAGNIMSSREYYFTNADGKNLMIQDHSAGHPQFGESQHFNVRPANDPRHGNVAGTQSHYYYK